MQGYNWWAPCAGVFMLKYIEHVLQQLELTLSSVSQDDMAFFRTEIVHALVQTLLADV